MSFKKITRKPILPSDVEIKLNNRARSAKLRVAEKFKNDNTNLKKLIHELRSRSNEFYVNRLAPENLLVTSWRLVLFIVVLAVLVVYSSHKVDQKVIRINKLKVELKDLRSRHIDMRTTLMSLSKTTNVAEEVKMNGLLYSSDAPYKIKIED